MEGGGVEKSKVVKAGQSWSGGLMAQGLVDHSNEIGFKSEWEIVGGVVGRGVRHWILFLKDCYDCGVEKRLGGNKSEIRKSILETFVGSTNEKWCQK